jgi:predicted ATP-grasp superfamily ATP-dependent carboligase
MPAPEADAELSAMTTRFFREAGVTGLAAMEYKRDSRNGQFRMVEPTIGRTDYQAEVATLNGVNLPYAAYCDMVESSCMAGRTMRSVGWRVRSEDVQSAAMQGQRENDGFDGCADVADALWRWSDPVPSVLRNLRRVRNSLKLHVVKKLPKSRPLESKS